jgi:L-alanine-DL-glutamate epimerase-like enolase superfamily enzyme
MTWPRALTDWLSTWKAENKMGAAGIQPVSASLFFLPVETRIPLKFGTETLTYVTIARVRLTVKDRNGHEAQGWGETPLSVQWVWPSKLSYSARHETIKGFCKMLANAWSDYDDYGHPLEVSHRFQRQVLPQILDETNRRRGPDQEPMPWLAALVSCSPFDIALHDAYGNLLGLPVYQTYSREFMNCDLAYFLEPADGSTVTFNDRYPQDFLIAPPLTQLPAWHLVGGLDALYPKDLTGDEPRDAYPVLLSDWITRDGLKCLKVKLRGNDPKWDYQRLVGVGRLAMEGNVNWLTSDFNCTVKDPEYVNQILDRLLIEHPRLYGMLLYVEQPFPYDLEKHRIDVHSVSARKPLFMDESAHDWELIRLGRELGWTGVALKTCKTQTGALLSLCWAKAHGMTLMVQDLTNPMLAQIPHVLLAAYAGTIMGVETNAMQFYPDASKPEAAIHPGLYRRRDGAVDLSTIHGAGFGYRLEEIQRELPPAVDSNQ